MEGRKRIAVIGAGMSGLAAAHRLHELDPSVHLDIFDSADRVGGVVRTEVVRIRTETLLSFRIEHGPDSLLTQVPWGLNLCRRLGMAGELIGTGPRHHGVYTVCRGRLRRVPDGLALMAPQRLWPIVTSSILSLRGKLRLACERFVAPRRDSSDESLAQFVTRRLGREAFERLVQPLVSGIYMGSPDCLSVRATFPRFVEMEQQHGSLIRAMRLQAAAATHPAGGGKAPSTGGPSYSMFVAPREGMEQIPLAIAARLPAEGIRLQSPVRELTRLADGRWRVIIAARPGELHAEFFDAVVVATSAPAAARLLHDAVPSLAAELAAIDHTSCVVANLAFRRDQIKHPLDAFGFVSPSIERRSITACTFSGVKYADRAPQDWCLLRVFLGGAMNPQAIEWTDNEVRRAALSDLQALLGARGEPLFFKVQRWRRTMPQYELGHLDRLERMERIIQQLPSLALAGNAYRGAGVAHCIQSGERAAERLLEHLKSELQFSNLRS
jgi:protoporphyrinogen/coproporphyrinogen III oxidase